MGWVELHTLFEHPAPAFAVRSGSVIAFGKVMEDGIAVAIDGSAAIIATVHEELDTYIAIDELLHQALEEAKFEDFIGDGAFEGEVQKVNAAYLCSSCLVVLVNFAH